jgi:hypothetical protein
LKKEFPENMKILPKFITIASKMMKPILVDFLRVYLHGKNIVWQICDTFV